MNATPLRFWSLLGQKAGDNRQLEALAQGAETRLGWVGEPRALAFRGGDLLLQLTRQPSLAALQPQARASLKAPWPDLVLTAGRRNEPVARWIQQQSGGRCAIVHVGRPWTPPHRFDLTLTTAQYALAEEPGNIVMLPAPLAPPRAPKGMETRTRALLLLGGPSGAQALSPATAVHLLQRFRTLAHRHGLTPCLSTSPRTPGAVERALKGEAQGLADGNVFLWHAAQGQANPLPRWLETAQLAVVTGDSMSMVLEALSAGCLTAYAPLPKPLSLRWESLSHRLAQRLAPRRFRRNTQALLDSWQEAGWLWPLSELEPGPLPSPGPGANTLAASSLDIALEALAKLPRRHPAPTKP